jgi:hypothetical protein
VVVDVERVTDWGVGLEREGQVAGISATTAPCAGASPWGAFMAPSLRRLFKSARACKFF